MVSVEDAVWEDLVATGFVANPVLLDKEFVYHLQAQYTSVQSSPGSQELAQKLASVIRQVLEEEGKTLAEFALAYGYTSLKNKTVLFLSERGVLTSEQARVSVVPLFLMFKLVLGRDATPIFDAVNAVDPVTPEAPFSAYETWELDIRRSTEAVRELHAERPFCYGFGQIIAAARKQKGLSPEQFTANAGVSLLILQCFEEGLFDNVELAKSHNADMEQICRAAELDSAPFLRELEAMQMRADVNKRMAAIGLVTV